VGFYSVATDKNMSLFRDNAVVAALDQAVQDKRLPPKRRYSYQLTRRNILEGMNIQEHTNENFTPYIDK
jgi:hypothetical protein